MISGTKTSKPANNHFLIAVIRRAQVVVEGGVGALGAAGAALSGAVGAAEAPPLKSVTYQPEPLS
jgi:hypothetical protein